MGIDVLDRTGRRVAEGKQANFVIGLADVVIWPGPPRLLDLKEQSTSVSAVFVDTRRCLLHWYMREMGSIANPLDVIWRQDEDISAVPREPSEGELLNSWNRYLEEHRAELVAEYKGKYVAIWKDSVYDSDEDLAALAERVYTALGYRPIFMPYIADKEQIYEFISSP